MIAVENVSKTYGSQVALAPVTLAFAPGTTTVLIGPSGCGKSTLLRLLVGLIRPESGRVMFDGVEFAAHNADELRHAVGYVIQDGGLFPHLTAEQNVTLMARYLKRDPRWIGERISELAELVRIPAPLLVRYPKDLSGGQRQRVSLMRALMLDPQVLLLDEPFGALDPITRSELQAELKGIFDRLGKTVILVTHDMNEAAYFAGDIALMRDGRVVQRGSVKALLEEPAEPFVRDFIRAQRSILAEMGG